ncbi:acyl-coenzyme A thioesterase PaaI-like protein [Catenulispora sp. EB89]|uniref:PaaI family thioesterase n=1 Tax=Catenulispora sp. EB89 TaxID=3156257 RepID=UPI003512B79D
MTVSTPQPPAPLTPAEAAEILAENFAPWIQALNLKVEKTTPTTTTLRLPWNQDLACEGGTLCGQALMAAADTATVLAISAARGAFCPMTTVQQNTTFQRPIKEADVLITARVTKLGRTLAFTDVTMTPAPTVGEGAGAGAESAAAAEATEAQLASPAAHATTVYALLA